MEVKIDRSIKVNTPNVRINHHELIRMQIAQLAMFM